MKTAYDHAKECIGITEWAKGSNPKIDEMFAEAGHPGQRDDLAWCAAFVGAMIKRTGGTPSGSLTARSYLNWGRAVDLDSAKPGDIVVFRRGNSTWMGHVGFYVSHANGQAMVLGGNQRDQVSIASQPLTSLLGIRRAVLTPIPVVDKIPPQTVTNAPSFWARIASWFKG